jgi:hypothetical protein
MAQLLADYASLIRPTNQANSSSPSTTAKPAEYGYFLTIILTGKLA